LVRTRVADTRNRGGRVGQAAALLRLGTERLSQVLVDVGVEGQHERQGDHAADHDQTHRVELFDQRLRRVDQAAS